MKYAPRKVYIKESGRYVELSYRDFCCRRQANQSYLDKLFIPIQGCFAQRSWLSSEESLVTMKQNIRKAVVQLARALGGGW